MTTANIIEIFCILDEFCKLFASELKKQTIQAPGKRHRNRSSRMSDSEIMTILVLFHTHRFRDLKSFYLGYVCQHMRKDFPQSRVLHALRGASGSGGASPVTLPTDLRSWQVHGHIHHRLHAPGVLPHQAGEAAQDHEGMGCQGVVLRIQAASGHQRQGGDYPVAAYSGECRRPSTAEGQTLHGEASNGLISAAPDSDFRPSSGGRSPGGIPIPGPCCRPCICMQQGQPGGGGGGMPGPGSMHLPCMGPL